jgi:hypothetical protein
MLAKLLQRSNIFSNSEHNQCLQLWKLNDTKRYIDSKFTVTTFQEIHQQK